MSATVKGKALRWAVNGLTFTAGIVSSTNPQLFQSADLERTSEKKNVTDGNGDPVSSVFYGQMKTFRCTVVPVGSAATFATANSSVDGHAIAPGTTMTAVDANGTIIDGSYNLLSAKLRLSNSDAVMVDLEMENAVDNDLTTANT